GLTTDTLDITGEVIKRSEFSVTRQQLEDALCAFRGEISQIPPMYSAVHSGGKRLYQLARQGIEVERTPRQVTIMELELLSYDEESGTGEIDVLCSKGTYIRALTDDIGRALGCGATLTALRRTMAAWFDISQAMTLETAQRLCDGGDIGEHILSVDAAFAAYPQVHISQAQAARYANGGELDLARVRTGETLSDGAYVRVYGNDEFIGLGIVSADKGILKPYKRFI
ncbi:MAG: tRNA pseudouridine(55) synthase TruB, partial [Clostridia bacterium]|nr:tRNA pseudouridine(55) synthase TruB [Clostridia bacterium]